MFSYIAEEVEKYYHCNYKFNINYYAQRHKNV